MEYVTFFLGFILGGITVGILTLGLAACYYVITHKSNNSYNVIPLRANVMSLYFYKHGKLWHKVPTCKVGSTFT